MDDPIKLLFSKLSTRTKVLGVGGITAIIYLLRKRNAAKKRRRREEEARLMASDPEYKARRKKRVAVDKEFVRRFKFLLKIIIPSFSDKNFFLLLLHTGFLVARTLTSIFVAQLDGAIVKSIVQKNARQFAWHMFRWLAVAVPATYINSMIRYLESKLSIAFRSKLVNHTYAQYFKNETYYRIGNLDSRLSNPDQCLTEDMSQFCSELANLYSNLSKPCLDIVLMTGQLVMLAHTRHGDASKSLFPAVLATGVIGFTGFLLRSFTPPFGKMIAKEAQLDGSLRAAHSRVITHAEEIAFYKGEQVEEGVLRSSYKDLVSHMNFIYKERIFFTMLEQFLMKYTWGACGLTMIAIPTFMGKAGDSTISLEDDSSGDSVSDRTEDFVTARGLLISAADAIERMMSSWKNIAELAGRTARVYDMIEIFDEVENGKYVKQTATANLIEGNEGKDEKKQRHSTVDVNGVGKVIDHQDFISLEDVPVVTPNGDILISDPGLNFEIKKGQHLLITGPNGCGKSSLFRMIGGLWPVHGGVMHKPSRGDMFYIPQRPYLTKGTLREQFIYPDTDEIFFAKGGKDEDLLEILDIVSLAPVIDREGGWDARSEWRDVLSGGEKQRVGMARLFYHKPHFAILDECTSQVSVDVEGIMYTHAKAIGITLLTVTHRPTLWKYHTHLLQFNGEGGWTFSPLNADARLTLREEKTKLEQTLAGLPAAQARLKEICGLLGEDSRYVSKEPR